MTSHMKLATHLTLSLLLMISIRAAATGEFDAVVDSDGDEVKSGVEYYMFAAFTGNFSLGSAGCSPRPLDVIIDSSPTTAIPLTFLPRDDDTKPAGSVVRVSTDLNIKFNAQSDAESIVWNLEHDRCINRPVVTTGGNGVNGWFKFENVGQFIYRIVSCTPNSPACGYLTYPVADFNYPRKRLLISSSSSVSTDEHIILAFVRKANYYTQAQSNLMMNINGIRTSH